jgi:imidazolonepropionase-like amidohydrolase
MIDGLGGALVSPAVVAIAGSKIIFAGREEDALDYPGAKVISLEEECLLPGLIDMHAHPTYYWEESDLAPITLPPGGGEKQLIYSPVMIGLRAAKNLYEVLMAGITTIRDVASVSDIMFDVKRAIQKGLIPGPKCYVAGRLIVPTGGHCHYLPGFSNQADGPYGYRRAVREEIRAGADLIKLAVRGSDATQEELNAAVDEAHRLGKKVVCHTSMIPAVRMAIEAGVDTIEHSAPTKDEIDLMVKKGIAWDPTLQVGQLSLAKLEKRLQSDNPEVVLHAEKMIARRLENQKDKQASIKYSLKAGLKILAGTDNFTGPAAAIANEVRCLVDFGCTPMQAILAATLWPSQVMGWDDIGTLEKGKLADVIAVSGDPLVDIGALDRVVLVVREGEVVNHKMTI